MSYIGYYINLDRSADRRAAMEAKLMNLSPPARYRRFPAVDGNPYGVAANGLTDSEIGVFYSHYLLLQMHLDGASHLHVIEDDIVLAKRAPLFLEQVVLSGQLDNFDLLFTESAVAMFPDICRDGRGVYENSIERAEDGTAAKVEFGYIPYAAGMTSYLVNRRSIGLISDLLGQELERGASRPIDLFLRDQAKEGKIRAQCLFPFVTATRPGDFASLIADPNDHMTLSRLTLELMRYSFFVECDFATAMALAEQGLTNPNAGLQERLHARLMSYIASDSYKHF